MTSTSDWTVFFLTLDNWAYQWTGDFGCLQQWMCAASASTNILSAQTGLGKHQQVLLHVCRDCTTKPIHIAVVNLTICVDNMKIELLCLAKAGKILLVNSVLCEDSY